MCAKSLKGSRPGRALLGTNSQRAIASLPNKEISLPYALNFCRAFSCGSQEELFQQGN